MVQFFIIWRKLFIVLHISLAELMLSFCSGEFFSIKERHFTLTKITVNFLQAHQLAHLMSKVMPSIPLHKQRTHVDSWHKWKWGCIMGILRKWRAGKLLLTLYFCQEVANLFLLQEKQYIMQTCLLTYNTVKELMWRINVCSSSSVWNLGRQLRTGVKL